MQSRSGFDFLAISKRLHEALYKSHTIEVNMNDPVQVKTATEELVAAHDKARALRHYQTFTALICPRVIAEKRNNAFKKNFATLNEMFAERSSGQKALGEFLKEVEMKKEIKEIQDLKNSSEGKLFEPCLAAIRARETKVEQEVAPEGPRPA